MNAGNIESGGRIRLNGGNANGDSGSQLVLWSDSSGYCYIAGYTLRFMTGSNNARTEKFTMNQSGDFTATGSVNSPIFYDSNNTNYYVNPAGESKLHTLNIENGTTSNNRIVFKSSTTSGYSALRFNYGAAEQNTIHLFGSTWSSNFEGGSRGAINLSAYTGVTFGAWNSPGAWVYNSGQAQFNNSVRSPIFYDSNDTNYFVDPASTSNINRLLLTARNDNYFVGCINGTNNQNNWQDLTNTWGQFTVTQYNNIAASNFTNEPSGVYTYGSVLSTRTQNHSFQLYSAHTGDLAYKTQWNNDNYSGWRGIPVYGANTGSPTTKDLYSTRVYDSNNTAYFIDPHSTSQVNTIEWVNSTNNGRFFANDWGIKLQTDAGYIHFGPANTSHAHLYTDRTNFYFNKQIQLNGGTLINTNDVRSDIFYSKSDATYYTYPNSTSNLYGLTVNNAATIVSNTSSRVLYLKQQGAGVGNIIQFQNHNGSDLWENVGRDNGYYIYNGQNAQGYALFIRHDNNHIGIKKNTGISYNLDVTGTIRASGDVIAYSDRRVKENIITIDNALEKVTKLRGVSYNRTDLDDKSTKIGVIAQEVLEVVPELVEEDIEGKYSVSYGNMAGIFIEAIKELKQEINDLKQEIKTLKNN